MLRMEIRELGHEDAFTAYAAMRELRPHVATEESFVNSVREQFTDGYRVIAAFAPGTAEALAACGFRRMRNLAWGDHVYIDDLSTLPAARGQGAATALLQWVHGEAERLGCEQVHLDSGVQPERQAAHRLYFTKGYRISSYHFQRTVG